MGLCMCCEMCPGYCTGKGHGPWCMHDEQLPCSGPVLVTASVLGSASAVTERPVRRLDLQAAASPAAAPRTPRQPKPSLAMRQVKYLSTRLTVQAHGCLPECSKRVVPGDAGDVSYLAGGWEQTPTKNPQRKLEP